MFKVSALVLLLLAACGGASVQSEAAGPEVSLAVTPATASPGESVTLTLRNGTSDEIGYNLCNSGLQRQASGGSWEPVSSDRVCTMELRTLAGGGETTYDIDLPPDLAPGEYRFTTSIETMPTGSIGSVASEPFSVGS